MDARTILSKIIALIYRTRLLGELENDDLTKTVLGTIETDSPDFNFLGKNSVKSFKDLCMSLLEETDPIPKEVLIPQVSIVLENDPKLLKVVKDSIEQEYDDSSSKRIITNITKTLNNYYREQLAVGILSKLSYNLKFNRNKIGNFGDYLQNAISELEPLTTVVSSMKDPAVVNELDFENSESVEKVFNEVKNLNNNKSVYKTGWQGLNRMTQGGIRRGEFVTMGALQHKYKTGSTLSMFMQIALHNQPVVTPEEAGKKPLLLRISFEDSLTNNVQFMYQYLKAVDGEMLKPKDFEYLDSKDMTQYVMKKLTATGFHVKMMRVDPSQWTYSSIFNKILEYEAQGYCVHLLMVDYLLMIPTTGCVQGATGADKRDLIRRVRNFCSARAVAFLTPLQLSTEAKQLTRNGVPNHMFLKEIAEKGYYDGCRTVDQEIDLELYVHLFSHKGKKLLQFQRGKHRLPTVIPDEDLNFMLQFPGLNIPVLEDINGEDSSFTRLPTGGDSSSNSGLLDEILG